MSTYMAKQRMINTRFWDDSFVVGLDPIEKLLFVYLLTNALTNIAGAYEIGLRRIIFDTGIKKERLLQILDRFAQADKVIFEDGWVFIVNFLKHQNLKNDKIAIGVATEINNSPLWARNRVSIAYPDLSHLIIFNSIELNTIQLNSPAGDVTENPQAEDSPKKRTTRTKKPLTTIPDDFTLTDKMREWAKENTPTLDIDAETKAFISRCKAKGTEYKEWESGWHTQMLNAVKFAKTGLKQKPETSNGYDPTKDMMSSEYNPGPVALLAFGDYIDIETMEWPAYEKMKAHWYEHHPERKPEIAAYELTRQFRERFGEEKPTDDRGHSATGRSSGNGKETA